MPRLSSMSEDNALILVCDDHRQAVSLALSALEDQGWEVVATQSSAIAYSVATELPRTPDLILLDILMPDMDGYELAAKLQKHHKTRAVPIIFVTCLGNTAEEKKGFDLGAVDYVVKPYSIEVLRARVRNQLEIAKRRRRAVECECQRQQAIIATITDGVIILNSSGIITEWSAQVATICGFGGEEALGMHITEIMTPGVRRLHEGVIDEAFAGKRPDMYGRRIRSEILCKGHGYVPVEVSIGLASIGEEIALTVRDLRPDLDAVDDGRKRAHDAMAAMAFALARQTSEPLAAARAKLAAVGDAEAVELARDLGELANLYDYLAEMDQGTGPLDPINTQDCIERAVKVCSEQWRKQMGHGLTVHVPTLPPVRAHCYALDSILHGLICRAIQACCAKGQNHEAKIAVSAIADNGRVCIYVEDNGGKVADVRKIFEPFRPESSAEAGGPPLYICKQLARRYGGDLSLKTNKANGAVFEVWLPGDAAE